MRASPPDAGEALERRLELLAARERWHRWQAEVLELIASDRPVAEVLECITLAMEDLAQGSIASIVLLAPDGRHIRHAAAPHLPESFVRACDGEPIGPAAGSCGTAMFLGKRVIVTDIATDPLWEPYRDLALAHELRACWSTPVTAADGRVLATLALYYRESRAPSDDDLDHIDRFVHLAAIAIERARTLESLRESEEKFQQFANNVQQVFWLRDHQVGRMFYVSPAYERIWGLSCQSLYENPKQWLESIHEEDRERVVAAVAANPDQPYEAEYRIVRPDGEVRWIIDRGFPVMDAEGAVSRIVGTATDITLRKQTEWELRESEQRFHAISAATSDVQWDWDLASDTIWWSSEFSEIFGHDPAIAASETAWLDLIHPEDRERVANSNMSAIHRGDEFWQSEYRLRHRDGHFVDVEDHGCLIRDESGTPVRLVGGIADVTERKRSQRELRERMKELRCLYEVLDLTQDQHRDVGEICRDIARALPPSLLYADAAVARVVLDGEEHPGDGWREPEWRRVFDIVAERARVGFVEVGYAFAQPIADMGPDPFLAEEVEMGSAVAAHIGRMIENRRMASRLTRSERLKAIGELTGGIAHDFNNLLTVILGNAEIIANSLPADHSLAKLGRMTMTAATRGADLTNRLLAFARRQALSPSPTDVGALVESMRPLLGRTLGEHIEIAVTSAAAAWPAMVDASQLENAILNLCINARDAMPGGGSLSIEISNTHLDASYAGWSEDVTPGPYLMVVVSDTGIGMTRDVLQRAFEPFFTTKDVGKGSGLGLSMVYGFARQSRGHAMIYSEPGQGTSVKLFLPRADSPAKDSGPAASTDSPPGGSERILLVEDDDLVRTHVAAQLENLGYRVVSAGSGREALDILERDNAFDLLFSDVVMPGGITGVALAEAARRIRPDLPVLLTSGYSEASSAVRGGFAGFPVLGKPYRLHDMALALRKAIGGG